MAERPPKENCTQHTIEINNLKKDMERIKDHEQKFNRVLDRLEEKVDLLSDTTLNINSTLLHLKDIPDRIRKLEDKSIVYDLVKLGLGIMLGVFITNYVGDLMVNNRDKNEYKIENKR